MSLIFISYRRSDSIDVTGRIYEHLTKLLTKHRVFKDVFSIAIGEDFRSKITASLKECRLLLVVIGDHWLDAASDDGRRRLDDPNDYVRIEIETALNHPGMVVIPVIIGKDVPKAELLPASIRELAFKNGLRLRPDPDFESDMQKLLQRIDGVLGISRRRMILRGTAMATVSLAAIPPGVFLFKKLLSGPPTIQLIDDQTTEIIIRDFVMNYQSDKATNESAQGHGGQLVVPKDFKEMLSVETQGYTFDVHKQRPGSGTILLDRLPFDYQTSILPSEDFSLPSRDLFEDAMLNKIDPADFYLSVANQTNRHLDLLFHHFNPNKNAEFTLEASVDPWELVMPPLKPDEERKLDNFHRIPGLFLIFASSNGQKAQHLLTVDLYSGKRPRLTIKVTSGGLKGYLSFQ